jgi:ATP-dependent helicase/DNAse subunit B
MDMHVVVGPPGSGKAGRAVAQLCDGSTAGREMFLVVPGAVDRARFLREIAARESRVMLGVEVGTFDQLVARVAGSPPVRRTDAVMERIIVRDALERCGDAFAGAARWSGFVDTARRFIDRMRSARVWGSDHLERVLGEIPGGSVEAWLQLEQQVEELLRERRLRDDAWFEQRAADAIKHGRCGIDGVVVYGFDTLADHRVELLERLAGCVSVHVSLEWSPGRIVYERSAVLRDRWRSKGAFIEELEDAVVDTNPTLHWLGNELFEPNDAVAQRDVTAAPDEPAPVAFVDCCGSLQEADEVAREIVQLRARGFAWDDIAVLSANAAQDAEFVVAACDRAGIPLRTQVRRGAIDVPAGRAIHDLLEALCIDDAVAVLGALRAPIFGLDRAHLDRAELRARAARAVTVAAASDPRMLVGMPAPVTGLVASASAPGSAMAAMREMLANLLPSDMGEFDLVRGVASALEGVATAAGGDANIDLADIRDTVARFPLTQADRSDSGAVVLSSIDDVRSVTYPAVVLRGVHQAAFRPSVEVDTDAPAAARELLHLAVTRARTTLRVVRQSSGSNGNPLAPSPAWIELRRRLPDAPRRTRRLDEIAVGLGDARHAAEVPLAVARATSEQLRVGDVPEHVQRAITRTQRRARPDHVSGDLARDLAATTRIAATAVETYATCSAMWFIDRRLRVRDVDDDRSRLVEGNVAHELLARVVRTARFESADAATLRAACAAALPELLHKHDPAGSIDTARAERIVTNVVDTLLTEGVNNWDVPDAVLAERALDSASEEAIGPGLIVDGVEVTGRVDRIDQYGSHVVLHDYKYRASDVSVGNLLSERKLQLLIYWLALERPGSPYEPIGALYRAVTNHGSVSGLARPEVKERGLIAANRRAGILDDEARAKLLDDVRTLVADSLAALRSGIVRPLDDPADCPAHCQLQTICRVGEVEVTA